MLEDSSNTQLTPAESEKIPGYVKRKIKERKTSKERPLVARARASQAHVSTKKDEKLHDLLARHLPGAARAWVDGLNANKVAWNQQSHQFEDTGLPDHKIRSECAEKIWHNVIGRPIERSMEVSGSYKELSQVIDELRQSPEAVRLLGPDVFAAFAGGNSLQNTTEGKESASLANESEKKPDSEQKTG
jgi:hypothetical protein